MDRVDTGTILALRGPKGDPGVGVQIDGVTTDTSGLPVSPVDNEQWLVGDDLYMFITGSWMNYGPIRGPQGATGPQGIQGVAGPNGPQGPIGPQGPQGTKGDPGTGLSVLGVKSGPGELPASGGAGDAWLVPGSGGINDVWFWDTAATTWVNGGQLQGPVGPQGPAGVKGDAGPAGPVGASGPIGAPGPKGDKGDAGATGAIGPAGPPNMLQVGTVDSTTGGPSVEIVGDAPNQTVNFLLKEGPQGPQGLNGPQGIQGLKGDKGDPGVGMVSGGATGQVLRKASSSDHDAVWDDDIGAAFAIDAEPRVSQLVTDVAAVDTRVGGVEGDVSTLKLGQTRTNLRSEGLSLDGTTDETAALQAIIDNASNGEILVLDERANLRVSSQIIVSGKSVSLQGYGDATIQSTAIPADIPLVRFVAAHGASIDTVNIIGAETSFVGGNNSLYALDVDTSHNTRISNVKTSQTSRGARVRNSDNTTVENFSFEGMITDYVLGCNWHTSLYIMGSNRTHINGLRGHNVGSTLLVGFGGSGGTADGVFSHNAYDNGVYISGGEDWQINNPFVKTDVMPTTAGGGVKMRGRNHVLLGGYIENVTSGIMISDDNTTPAPDGTAGHGSKAIGTRVYRTNVMGATIEQEYNGPPRDMAILYCSFDSCNLSGSGSGAAIRARNGSGHQIIGNSIARMNSGYAGLYLQGTVEAPIGTITVALNKFHSITGIDAIRTEHTNDSVVAMNEFRNTVGNFSILLRAGTNRADVYGNRQSGTGPTVAGIRASADTGSNRITDNPRMTVQNMGAATNVMYGNATGNPAMSGADTTARLASLEAILRAQGVIN